MRVLFFFLGLPMMIMSFMHAADALPYVQNIDLLVNGQEIVLEETQQAELGQHIADLMQGSHTMPAFGVVFGDDFANLTQDGTFVSLKFDRVFEVNGLPFDELVFQVCPDWTGFNLFRGMNGVFEGRCIYIDLVDKDMSVLAEYINTLPQLTMAETPKVEETPETVETAPEQDEEDFKEVERQQDFEQTETSEEE